MKVLIITLHSAHNPGTALQAFALNNFLLESGYDCSIIDYRPPYLITGTNAIKAALSRILFFPFHWNRSCKFSSFLKKNIKLTPQRYTSYVQLVEHPPAADLYITGSDQVWNCTYPCGRDEAFYLKFVRTGRKISYAASLGSDQLDEESIEFISNNIQPYSFISVREASTIRQFELPLQGRIHYVADPTLLLDREKYIQIASPPNLTHYLVVYLVEKSELLDKLVRAVSTRYGLKVLQIGSFTKKIECDVIVRDLGPKDFLGYILNADFVIAGSFHASVFSCIFCKNFALIAPKKNAARMTDFLKNIGLKHRIVHNDTDIDRVLEPIAYDLVNQRLAEFTNRSKQLLLDNIEQ